MTRQVYLSGQLVAEEDAKISIFDSAVLLGDTVTESTRTFGHCPFKLSEHIHRLYKSLKVARIDPGILDVGRDFSLEVCLVHRICARTTSRLGGQRHVLAVT